MAKVIEQKLKRIIETKTDSPAILQALETIGTFGEDKVTFYFLVYVFEKRNRKEKEKEIEKKKQRVNKKIFF